MARHCYLCDREIVGTAYRRWAAVGHSSRGFGSIGRSGPRVGASNGSYTCLRTLCRRCATTLDRNPVSEQVMAFSARAVLVAVIALPIALIWLGSSTAKHEPTTYVPPSHVAAPASVVDPVNK